MSQLNASIDIKKLRKLAKMIFAVRRPSYSTA